MIDKPTIARIMDSTKIEEVVSEFVTLKKRGINYIGVITKSGKDVFYYITPLEDMFGPHSFAHFGDTRQRGLPVTKFRMNPAITPAIIAKAVRVR